LQRKHGRIYPLAPAALNLRAPGGDAG